MSAHSISPLLALAVGDPSGIGPEVTVKALAARAQAFAAEDAYRVLTVGPAALLARTVADLRLPLRLQEVDGPQSVGNDPQCCYVLDPGPAEASHLPFGRVQVAAGKAALTYLEQAATLVLQREAAALVTGPLHKLALQAVGRPEFLGNTEVLEHLCSRHSHQDYRNRCMTLLMAGKLRVAHVTRHIPFADIVTALTEERLAQTVRLTAQGLPTLGIAHPRLAVAGLNPHNGDGGLLGNEEQTLIAPTVAKLRQEGIDVHGPIPADSVFFQAIDGRYDAVIALYHDQGHIAVKVHGFEESITVSLGLPLIRTSVDHGTAFDIAGRGCASSRSMETALQLAARMALRSPEASPRP